MNRRGFFRAALGLAAAPLLPALTVPAAAAGTLFRGELGRYNGVNIVRNMKPAQDELNRFYSGLQWSPEDIDELRKRGASPLVINKVRPAVDAFIAQQRAAARLRWA